MKLSFTTMATPELTGVQAIQAGRQYGYGGIDLRVSEQYGELTLSSSKEHIDELKDCLAGEGIELASLMAYNETGGADEASWLRMQDDVSRHVELACEMGAAALRVFLGKKPAELPGETYQERIAAVLAHALQDTSDHMTLLLQNHRQNLNIAACTSIIRQINHPRLGLIASPEHCLIQGEGVREVGLAAAGWTRQVYLADIRMLPTGYEDVLPGTGDVPLKSYFDAIGGTAFEGWITLKWEKVWRPHLAEYKIALPFFQSYAKEVLGIR
ncbi:MAG: hypothetical protein K0R57_225 [Paenibacillaceae bacterium]|nr:hypothetical protein [Paenibacillaceae bacterium]